MRLKVLLPTEVLIDKEVTKVVAEAENGSFCLLPHHIDFVATLFPGLLSFSSTEGGKEQEEFIAADEGTLVKCGGEVTVSTENAVRSTDLESLKRTVEGEFRAMDDRERAARLALAKLEANFIRRFIQLKEQGL